VVLQANEIMAALKNLPGVASVGGANVLPLSGNGGDTYVFDSDNPPDNWQNVESVAEIRVATGDYLEVMGISMKGGRYFQDTDVMGGPPVVVINETLADRIWPGTDPVGRRLTVAIGELTEMEVIGVASDVKQFGLTAATYDLFYLAHGQFPRSSIGMVIRTAGDPLGVASSIREAVWSVDPTQPMAEISTINSLLERSLAPQRFQTALLGMFALLAILLAAIGVYGVLAYAVSQQQRDIGIRVALGARRQDVIRMVVRNGLRMVLLGLALGAFFATHALASMLFQIAPSDPASFVTGAVILGGVACVATYLPAHRAANVDPMVALRSE
jgi:putative ABC transport system permease protein